MPKQASCKITLGSLKFGRLNVPVAEREDFPHQKIPTKLNVEAEFPKGAKKLELTYGGRVGRIFGLRKWYKENKVKAGDYAVFEVIGSRNFRLTLKRKV